VRERPGKGKDREAEEEGQKVKEADHVAEQVDGFPEMLWRDGDNRSEEVATERGDLQSL
jgi:hypothetical protein